jgi:uncharacterized protein
LPFFADFQILCVCHVDAVLARKYRRRHTRDAMKFELDHTAGARIIRSYGPGEFTVGEQRLHGSIVLAADRIIVDLLPADITELNAAHLDQLCALQTDLIVIGTGRRQIFPPYALITSVLGRGVGCEIMDTAAACRCYNVLLAESRSVAAALFSIRE